MPATSSARLARLEPPAGTTLANASSASLMAVGCSTSCQALVGSRKRASALNTAIWKLLSKGICAASHSTVRWARCHFGAPNCRSSGMLRRRSTCTMVLSSMLAEASRAIRMCRPPT